MPLRERCSASTSLATSTRRWASARPRAHVRGALLAAGTPVAELPVSSRGAPAAPRAARRAPPGDARLREPGRDDRRARRARPRAVRGAPRRRPVVVGGRVVPRALAARVRRRRRGVGGLALRRRRVRGRLAGAGRPRADAGARARRRAGRPRRARPAEGRVPLRPRLRLRQRRRAQEPARRDRGVHPRVRPAGTARRSCSRRCARTTAPAEHARRARRRRRAPARARDRPRPAGRGEERAHRRCSTATVRCIARRASA